MKSKKDTNKSQEICVRDVLLNMVRDIDLGNDQSYWENFELLLAIHEKLMED